MKIKDIRHLKAVCKDYTKIENYEEAISDTNNKWHCHHKLGIMPFSHKTINSKKLKEYGLYYNQPPEALIFIKESEHHKLHNSCMSDEWHTNLSNAAKNQKENSGRFVKSHKRNNGRKRPDTSIRNKEIFSGKQSWNKGLILSDEHKKHLSESHKGKHWKLVDGKRVYY